MKVLHVFKTYLPDSFTGVERVIWEICEGSARHGIESHVLSLSEKPRTRPVKIGRHWAHSARTDIDLASTPLSACVYWKFKALLECVDLVHYHFPWPMMDLLHLAARSAKPSVVTYHSDIVRQKNLLRFYEPVMHRFLGGVGHIVATSPNYAASSPVLARYAGKLSVIPIGLDPARLARPSESDLRRWRDRLPARFFLFVGALRYYKGLSFLVEAARMTGLPVVVAGGGGLPEDLAAGLPANVQVVGRVSDTDKAALLHLCEAFVFPSHLRSEAFGVALLEAAFAGKAMISCEIGTGTSYVNLDDVTGLVVAPADADALAGAMRVLWDDPARARLFGDAARDRAMRLFLAGDMAEAYRRLYERQML